MNTTDPIADLLTRLRNSVQAKQLSCMIPASQQKEQILKILKSQGYIKNYVLEADDLQGKLIVSNKYIGKNLLPVIHSLKRISKPGCRIYRGYRDLKPLLGGSGLSILSTPLGILTDEEARKSKVGGEVLCEVW